MPLAYHHILDFIITFSDFSRIILFYNCLLSIQSLLQFYCASYASTVLAVIVCLSVGLSQVGVVQKWLNLGSHQQRSTIAQRPQFQFPDVKNLGEIPTTSPPAGAPNRGGVGSHRRFSTNISLYLRNGVRQGHTFYGRLIETHMRSIEWRYIQ